MLREKILFSIIFVGLQLMVMHQSFAHSDLNYNLSIDSVVKTEANLIIKGTLIFVDRDYGGPVLPKFSIYGITGKPLIGDYFERNALIQPVKLNGKITHAFTFDLMNWIKSYLPKNAVNIRIKSYIKKPRPNMVILYKNRMGGEQIPFAEVTYNNGVVISIYLSVPPPLQKNPPLQIIEELKH